MVQNGTAYSSHPQPTHSGPRQAPVQQQGQSYGAPVGYAPAGPGESTRPWAANTEPTTPSAQPLALALQAGASSLYPPAGTQHVAPGDYTKQQRQQVYGSQQQQQQPAEFRGMGPAAAQAAGAAFGEPQGRYRTSPQQGQESQGGYTNPQGAYGGPDGGYVAPLQSQQQQQYGQAPQGMPAAYQYQQQPLHQVCVDIT